MTINKKALEIVGCFYHKVTSIALDEKQKAWESAKQAGLIAADLIIEECVRNLSASEWSEIEHFTVEEFWNAVKDEIKRL